MAQINISTTQAEQEAILQALRELSGQTISVATIARCANLRPTRARYAITDLYEAGKIKRVPTKAFNKHYIRYMYEVVQ